MLNAQLDLKKRAIAFRAKLRFSDRSCAALVTLSRALISKIASSQRLLRVGVFFLSELQLWRKW